MYASVQPIFLWLSEFGMVAPVAFVLDWRYGWKPKGSDRYDEKGSSKVLSTLLTTAAASLQFRA